MNPIPGRHVGVRTMDQLAYIGDLVNVEGPLLSLLRTRRQNWLLLWCDTDGSTRHRYLLQPVSRNDLIAYLEKKRSLRQVLTRDSPRYLLDVTGTDAVSAIEEGKRVKASHRYLREVDGLEHIEAYLPAADSYFDEELSPDFSATSEYVPLHYDIRIDGEWFATDLQKFSAVYEQIYDFFYCTATGFVTNIGSRVKDYLRAPWRGGFSRVNLFRALKNFVPSLHDLRISEIEYASPGKIRFEALKSVGAMIKDTTRRYVENRADLVELERKLSSVLSGHHLKSRDVSHFSDSQLGLARETVEFIGRLQAEVASLLDCEKSISAINEQAPNAVISAKVVVAFLVRVRRLGGFEQAGLIGRRSSRDHGDRLAGLVEVD